jgi:hypothetical protein
MSIENLKKHMGQLANTGVRVAVVFRKLPNDENSCLIVETERLPDALHDYLIQTLNSKEARETNDFYEVLNRRTFPDGTNCLTSLHQRGFLRKEPVTNITMLPLPNQPVPLALINATIDKKIDGYKANEAATKLAAEDTRTPEEKQAAAEALAAKMQDPSVGAKALISRADALEDEADALRERAYAMAPELKPGRGRPPTPEEERASIMEERKQRRRERDQRKAAQAKIERAEKSINDKVAAKIARDEARANSTAD